MWPAFRKLGKVCAKFRNVCSNTFLIQICYASDWNRTLLKSYHCQLFWSQPHQHLVLWRELQLNLVTREFKSSLFTWNFSFHKIFKPLTPISLRNWHNIYRCLQVCSYLVRSSLSGYSASTGTFNNSFNDLVWYEKGWFDDQYDIFNNCTGDA